MSPQETVAMQTSFPEATMWWGVHSAKGPLTASNRCRRQILVSGSVWISARSVSISVLWMHKKFPRKMHRTLSNNSWMLYLQDSFLFLFFTVCAPCYNVVAIFAYFVQLIAIVLKMCFVIWAFPANHLKKRTGNKLFSNIIHRFPRVIMSLYPPFLQWMNLLIVHDWNSQTPFLLSLVHFHIECCC